MFISVGKKTALQCLCMSGFWKKQKILYVVFGVMGSGSHLEGDSGSRSWNHEWWCGHLYKKAVKEHVFHESYFMQMTHNLVPERRAEGGGANDANRSQPVHNWRVKEDVVDKAPSVAALWEGAGERWDDTNQTACEEIWSFALPRGRCAMLFMIPLMWTASQTQPGLLQVYK